MFKIRFYIENQGPFYIDKEAGSPTRDEHRQTEYCTMGAALSDLQEARGYTNGTLTKVVILKARRES